MEKRTYRSGSGRMVARMTPLGEGVTHVFVEHPYSRHAGKRLDDFAVEGGFFEAMRHICKEYGCAWTRCDDRLFGY
jgi:hypothetical protein